MKDNTSQQLEEYKQKQAKKWQIEKMQEQAEEDVKENDFFSDDKLDLSDDDNEQRMSHFHDKDEMTEEENNLSATSNEDFFEDLSSELYKINQVSLLLDFVFFLKGNEEDDNEVSDVITNIEQKYYMSANDYFLQSNNEEQIIRICEKILQYNQNVKIDSQDKEGRTLLHMTAQFGLEKTAEYLLNKGCDITLKPNYIADIGYAFSQAILNGNFSIALLIIAEAKKRKIFDIDKKLATTWLLDLFYISRTNYTTLGGIWLIKNEETEKLNKCVAIVKELLLCGGDLSATTSQFLNQIYSINYHYSTTKHSYNNVFDLAEEANHSAVKNKNHLNILIKGIILTLKELEPRRMQNTMCKPPKNYKLTLLENRNIGLTKLIPMVQSNLLENIVLNVLCYFDNTSVEKIKTSMEEKWLFNVCWRNCLFKLSDYAASVLKEPPVQQHSLTRFTKNVYLVLECMKLIKLIPVEEEELNALTDCLLLYSTQDILNRAIKDYQLTISSSNILFVYVMSETIYRHGKPRFKDFFQNKNSTVLATIYLSSPDKRWKALNLDDTPFRKLKEEYSKISSDTFSSNISSLCEFIAKHSVSIQKIKLKPHSQTPVTSNVTNLKAPEQETQISQSMSPGV